MDIQQLALAQEPYIIEMRRYFHRHPELSWAETATTDTIVHELEAMGIEARRFPDHTGVLGILHGKQQTAVPKTLVLRADIDALPIEEKTGLPFESASCGVMHACGHDCHAAMLLGAARVLSSITDTFAGEIRLLFQAAEETSSGAEYYLEQGVLYGAAAIFGMHIWGDFDAPYLSIPEGPRMASCDNFKIVIHGVSAHGSAPHQGVDAIVVAAEMVLALQTIVSRNNDPRNPLVVTIGQINGGKRFNIIADQVELVGTVRTHNPAARAKVEPLLRRLVEHTAAAYGATAEVDYAYMAAAVLNDPALSRIAREAALKLYGETALGDMPPAMASEDFAYYLGKTPGVFCFLGARNAALGITATNHSDLFNVDESVLKRGAALYAQFAVDFLAADLSLRSGAALRPSFRPL